jgi:hypothetical protein
MIQPSKPLAERWRPNIMIFGASGTGKTRTWLDIVKFTGARALCIDTHHGTDAWVRVYPDGWDVVHSGDPDELEEQIDNYLTRPAGYTMFVIDDISVVTAELQNKADDELRPLRRRKDVTVGTFGSVMDPGSWGQLKRIANIAMNKLTHLDMARIVVARSKPHYEVKPGAGFALERRGKTWSGDKDMEYSFDLVLQLEKFGDRRVAIVEKARGLPEMPTMIEDFDAAKLLAALPGGGDGFCDPSKPAPVITATQAQQLRDLLATAKLEAGRQSRILNHYGAVSIEDLPAKNFQVLMAGLLKHIREQQSPAVVTDTDPKPEPEPQPETKTEGAE